MSDSRSKDKQSDSRLDEEKSGPSVGITDEAQKQLELTRLKSNDPTLITIDVNYKLLATDELTTEEKNIFFSALAGNSTVKSLGLNYLSLNESDMLELAEVLKTRKIGLDTLFIQGNTVTPAVAKKLSTLPIDAISMMYTKINAEAAMYFVENEATVKKINFYGGHFTASELLRIIEKNRTTKKLDVSSIESAIGGLIKPSKEQLELVNTKIKEMEQEDKQHLGYKK